MLDYFSLSSLCQSFINFINFVNNTLDTQTRSCPSCSFLFHTNPSFCCSPTNARNQFLSTPKTPKTQRLKDSKTLWHLPKFGKSGIPASGIWAGVSEPLLARISLKYSLAHTTNCKHLQTFAYSDKVLLWISQGKCILIVVFTVFTVFKPTKKI